MGVTTQRRAWIARVAVVVVAAAAGVFGVAAPAFAASVSVDPTNINLEAGQASEITVTVSDMPPAPPGQVLVTVSLPGEVGNNATVQGIDGCSHPCIKNKGPNNLTFRFRIRARPDVPSGIEAGGVGSITAGHPGESPFANTSFSLAVKGPDQQAPQQVPEVSGQVTDTSTGKGVPAAKVFLQDSAQHNFEGGTNTQGQFKFTSKPDAPIAPGTLSLIVEKEGYGKTERVEQGQAGVPLRLGKIAIASTTTASASAGAPSATSTDTAGPTLDGIDANNSAGNEEEAGLSWMLIAIGGVLVLLGIGAIVLLLVRRRDDGDDDEDAPGPRRGPPPGRAGPPRPPQPPRRGGPPERTTVMRGGPGPMGPPVSPGPRGADQTMIARSPLADMPTQMHRPLPAEPDPYATRQNGAHAAPHYPGGGYGPPPGPPPGPPAGYGAPPPPAGYPGGGPSYGHPDPQYGQPYPGGGPAYPGGGYEQPTYGQPYGQPPTSPYEPPAGYDPYDPRGQRPPPPPGKNDGRRVDWLDD